MSTHYFKDTMHLCQRILGRLGDLAHRIHFHRIGHACYRVAATICERAHQREMATIAAQSPGPSVTITSRR